MQPAPLPKDEHARIASLETFHVLDSTYEQAYQDLLDIAASICGTPIGAVSLIDRDRQWFKASRGLAATETSRDVAFCAHAILDPHALFVVADALEDARFSDNPLVTGAPSIRFYAGAPLMTTDGHAIGTLCVMDTEARELSAEQSKALQGLSRQVSALLELRRAYRGLKHHLAERAWYEQRLREQQAELEAHNRALSRDSLTDGLTGISNRRAFDAKLADWLAKKAEFHLALIDLDNFKAINDTHGHPAGDQCIVAIARLLEVHRGPHDLVARYGGEEFAWLGRFPGDGAAKEALDAVRAAVCALDIRHGCTISVGMTRMRLGEDDASSLIKRADAALYEAKRTGKDRVVQR